MTTVQQLLSQKGDVIWSVTPATKLRETIKLMAEKKIGAVLVIEKGKIEGIFSERDFVRVVAQNESGSLDKPVRDLMTKLVYYVPPELSMDECLSLMTEKKIRHLPVVENGELKGIISIGDVVKEVISEKDFFIRNLENYITGTDYNR